MDRVELMRRCIALSVALCATASGCQSAGQADRSGPTAATSEAGLPQPSTSGASSAAKTDTAIAASAIGAAATETAAATTNPEATRRADLPSLEFVADLWGDSVNARAVHAEGDLAYVVTNYIATEPFQPSPSARPPRLYVLDIADRANTRELSFLDLEGQPTDVTAWGGFVYMPAGSDGLLRVDATDPARPAVMDSIELDMALSVIATRGTLFVGTDEAVVAFDLADPAAPGEASRAKVGRTVDLDAVDGLVFAATSNQGLQIIDFDDVSEPLVVGHLGAFPATVYVSDDMAYGASGDRLTIADVGNAAAPTVAGRWTPAAESTMILSYKPQGASDVHGFVGRVFVADADGSLTEFDVHDPASPQRVADYPAPGGFADRHAGFLERQLTWTSASLAVVDDALLLAGPDGLRVFDGEASGRLVELDRYRSSPVETVSIELRGDTALLAATDRNIRLVDISSPTAPMDRGWLSDAAWRATDESGMPTRWPHACDADWHQGTAYVATSIGLLQVDVSDPWSPALLEGWHGWDERVSGCDLDVVGDTVYLALDGGGLDIFATDDSGALTPVGEYPLMGGGSRDVEVIRDLAYVAADSEGLHIVDVSDPANPRAVGSVSGIDADAVYVEDDLAFVVESLVGLHIYDVSDPAQPIQLSVTPLECCVGDLMTTDGRAYVANGYDGLLVVDVTDPSAPSLETRSQATGDGYVTSVRVQGDYVYASGSNTITIYHRPRK